MFLAEEQPLPPIDSPIAESPEITVRLQAAISLPPEAEIERLLAMPTLPPSPLASLSPPSVGERLARLASTQALIDAVIAALPSPPLPPPLHMPPPVNRRDDIPETEMPPRKRLCLSTLGSSTLDAQARRQGIGEVGYGVRDTWVYPIETVLEIAPMTMGERVNLLMEDRIADQETIQIVEEEVYAAREAWAHWIGLSQVVHSELQTHQEQVYAHEFQLQTHQTQLQLQDMEVESLRVMGDMRQEMGDMQAELLALREQPRRARQPRGDARFVADETKKIDKYVSRLPDNIYGSVKASKPKTLDETIELANDLMDQKLRTYAERQTNNKRKAGDSFRNNHGHQQQTPKRLEIRLSLAERARTRRSKNSIHTIQTENAPADEKEHEEHLKAILELLKKEKFALILALPKGSEDFVVNCDASHKGLGVVLMQRENVRVLVMTIGLDLPKQIQEAQIEAMKRDNLENEDLDGMIRKDIPKEKLEPRADGTLCLN
nr:reverse transcriptase domain-containing protein [Tanacetum cinerariifolium]